MVIPTNDTQRQRTTEADRTRAALLQLCAGLGIGDRVPTHTELMRRLHASERYVRQALDELVREGVIIRKSGSGTYIADRQTIASERPTVVALFRPDQSFFDRFMDLLVRECERQEVAVVCQPFDADGDGKLWGSPLGYLVFGGRNLGPIEKLRQEGKRVVLIGEPFGTVDPGLTVVANDHETGGFLVTRHLLDLGHRRIVFCTSGAVSILESGRWRGHLRALREFSERGVHVPAEMLTSEEIESWNQDTSRARAFFRASGSPTAIVGWNDHEAAKVLATLTRAGIRVPQEVSIVGHDALPEGELVFPSLTTVDHDMAWQASLALAHLIDPVRVAQSISSVPRLVIRESTAPPREENPA